MRLTVLGGCGAWPAAGQACSGYLLEHGDHRLVLDPGYATLPRLLEHTAAEDIDAVLVSHGHPDHCADLNPLLRARSLRDTPPRPLPLYALPGSLTAVLALDRFGMLDDAYLLHEFVAGDTFEVGPFRVDTALLPHFVPNAGMRIGGSGQRVLVYTGDTGPSPAVVELARDADLLLAEATYPDRVPAADAAFLSSARQAGWQAAAARVQRLALTHLWPGTDPAASVRAAAEAFHRPIDVAIGGMVLDLGT